jgi:hypothetical protein
MYFLKILTYLNMKAQTSLLVYSYLYKIYFLNSDYYKDVTDVKQISEDLCFQPFYLTDFYGWGAILMIIIQRTGKF